MSLRYYVDGYNVIYHCTRLRASLDRSLEAARDELIERVARFCSISGHDVRIVFDGRGKLAPPYLPVNGIPHLFVEYSTNRLSADSVIERYAYSEGKRSEIIVVSGDRGIRDLCRGMGAMVMTPDNFLATVDEAISREQRQLQSMRQTVQRMAIEDRLSGDSLSQLEALKKDLEAKE